jgi:acyl carrier protein
MNTQTDNDYEQVVSRLILESPQVKIKSVSSDMLLDDISVDSLEKLSIAMDLEDAYDIEITDDEVEQFTSVSDIIGYLTLAVDSRKEKHTRDENAEAPEETHQSVDNNTMDSSESPDAA